MSMSVLTWMCDISASVCPWAVDNNVRISLVMPTAIGCHVQSWGQRRDLKPEVSRMVCCGCDVIRRAWCQQRYTWRQQYGVLRSHQNCVVCRHQTDVLLWHQKSMLYYDAIGVVWYDVNRMVCCVRDVIRVTEVYRWRWTKWQRNDRGGENSK